MKNNELIRLWQEGNERLFRDSKTDKKMIERYLNEKALKETLGIRFNLLFYGSIQIVNLILLSLNLAGYSSHPTVKWIIIPQMVATIGILVFGTDLFYRLREINNYSESLLNLITRQLQFFRKPYEIWLLVSSISVIVLITNLNMFVDNDNGTYIIHNKLMYWGVNLGILLFIYGAQKLVALRNLRVLKAYLSDLQKGTLEASEKMERSKKKLIWIYIVIFIFLTATLVLGLLTTFRIIPLLSP